MINEIELIFKRLNLNYTKTDTEIVYKDDIEIKITKRENYVAWSIKYYASDEMEVIIMPWMIYMYLNRRGGLGDRIILDYTFSRKSNNICTDTRAIEDFLSKLIASRDKVKFLYDYVMRQVPRFL